MERSDGSFETERLVIRRFTADDWAGVQELAKDKESSSGRIYDHTWPTSEQGAKGMAGWLADRDTFHAACLADGGRIIGLVSFNNIDAKGRLDLAHMFHTEFREKGYDTEAIRCMVDLAFADPEVRTIVTHNAVDWRGQLTPLVALGFRETGRGRGSFAKDEEGKRIEFVGCSMEMTRHAWQRRAKCDPAEN